MAKQTELFKGELMEEKLRVYFLKRDYYVVRGVRYAFERNEITDVDLFLYTRNSSISREKINVDIKNKTKPKAFERILWTKGLQYILNFDKCIVATTDKREVVRNYGLKQNAIILDGNFLKKLPELESNTRLSEEELLELFNEVKCYDKYKNQTWKNLYELSKSRLLCELDFSGFNSTMILLNYFLPKSFDPQKKGAALRAAYLTISHALLMLDHIIKDIVIMDVTDRKTALENGFKYGSMGKEGVFKTIDMAVKMTGSKVSFNEIKKMMDLPEIDILKEFFSKMDNIKELFRWAIIFERLGFQKNMINPNDLPPDVKGVLTIFLDYFYINRKEYFNVYSK